MIPYESPMKSLCTFFCECATLCEFGFYFIFVRRIHCTKQTTKKTEQILESRYSHNIKCTAQDFKSQSNAKPLSESENKTWC